MQIVGIITIKFYSVHRALPPSHALRVLQTAGWQLVDNRIWYLHYVTDEGPDFPIEAPITEWENITALLDAKYHEGEIISVRFGYGTFDHEIWFYFQQQPDGTQEMWASIDDWNHRLCGRFPDFGWYLPKIVCPLYEAKYNILEVNCNADTY